MSRDVRKPIVGVSDQVRHKPGCTATEDGRYLNFRIWKAGGLYYSSGENKGADQLRGHREADLRLCFRVCKNPVFLTSRLINKAEGYDSIQMKC